MTKLDFTDVPDILTPASAQIERLSRSASVESVPGVLGWANHAGVRIKARPLDTCVCSSSYDHINLDVSPTRVSELYQAYPQDQSIITLAGLPDVLSPTDAYSLMTQWGADWGLPVGEFPPATGAEIYTAAPVFLLHRPGQGRAPLAIAACRITVSEPLSRYIHVDIELQQLGVVPGHRNHGLGHLLVLEASRWLGMLVRTIHFKDLGEWRLAQRVHASANTSQALQLAQAFYANYCFFGITDELIQNASRERRFGYTPPGSRRASLGTINGGPGFEEMILSPRGLDRAHKPADILLETYLK